MAHERHTAVQPNTWHQEALKSDVIYGDGKFNNAAGSVRLSGAVNMSALNSDGLIVFDCVFIIDI
jgi:hypothetical protein